MRFDVDMYRRFESRLHEAGIVPAIFPIGEGKRPAIRWSELGRGEFVYGGDTCAAYGIALGVRSGDLFVVDIDVGRGHDGYASAEGLGLLGGWIDVRSPSGGEHRYYLRTGVGSSIGWAPGVDIKGEGGYVIVPGSETKAGRYVLI